MEVSVQLSKSSFVKRDFSGKARAWILSTLVLSKETEFIDIPLKKTDWFLET